MSRDDWFRNSAWDSQIEAEFRKRLGRARSGKLQYLRIQAGYLSEKFPTVALALLDEYFAQGADFAQAQGHVDRAQAFLALNRHQDALEAYRLALKREEDFPNVKTSALLDYACLVALKSEADQYADVLERLDRDHRPVLFPADRYRASGARALILKALGCTSEAVIAAQIAVAASRETSSGLRYHHQLGLVTQTADEFGLRIEEIARSGAA